MYNLEKGLKPSNTNKSYLSSLGCERESHQPSHLCARRSDHISPTRICICVLWLLFWLLHATVFAPETNAR